jgi:hypothetical protein
MPSIKDVKIILNSSEEAKVFEGTELTRDNAAPSKPTIHFY